MPVYSILFFAFCAIFILSWYVYSPKIVVQRMVQAVESGTPDAFVDHIDFKQLQHSLKAHSYAEIMASYAHAPQSSLRNYGLALAIQLSDQVIETAVTPDMLSLSLKTRQPAEEWPGPLAHRSLQVLQDPNHQILRKSHHLFELVSSDGQGRLQFARKGLSWQLTGVRFADRNPLSNVQLAQVQAALAQDAPASLGSNIPLGRQAEMAAG